MGEDPSLTSTGVSLPNGQTFTIKTGGPENGWDRLKWLRAGLIYYAELGRPDLIVIEDLPTRSAGDVGKLGMAHGVAREVAATLGIRIAEIVPATLKHYATGSGVADKALMIAEANRFRPDDSQIRAGRDDEADADWLRRMGLHWAGGTPVSEAHAARTRDIWGPWKKSPGAKWPPPL